MKKINYNNGYYEGDVDRNGNRDGWGVYHYNTGDKYEGEWKNGQQHGYGE